MNISMVGLIISVIFLIGSIYALWISVLEHRVKLVGLETEAKVLSVERVVPSGFYSFLPKKEGTLACDYLLRLSYSNSAGHQVQIYTWVAARVKIKGGQRFTFFSEGDMFPIRYIEKHPHRIVILLDKVMQRQGRVFPIFLWAFCICLIVAIISMSFIT